MKQIETCIIANITEVVEQWRHYEQINVLNTLYNGTINELLSIIVLINVLF